MRVIGYVPGCKTCFCVVGDEVGVAIWPHAAKPSTAIAVLPQTHHNHAPGWRHPLEDKVKTRRYSKAAKPQRRETPCTASTAASQP